MPAAALPKDEAARLARLRDLAVMDTSNEPLFDALAKAAAWITGRPIALISLVDRDRQWFKANVGLTDTRQTPRDQAFCSYTILDDQLLEVSDALLDERFVDNPLVTGPPGIRFYAGAPIVLHDGLRMGSLCVIDNQPGALTDVQREALRELARAVSEALEQRAELLQRNQALHIEAQIAHRQVQLSKQLEQRLRASEAFLDRTGRAAGVGGWEVDLLTQQIVWSDATCRIHDLPAGHQPTMAEALSYFPRDARKQMQDALQACLATGSGWDIELPMVTATGREIWVRTVGGVDYEEGQPRRLSGALQDITLRRRAVAALEASERRFRNLFQYSLGLICTHDMDGVLLSINPAAAHSLGYAVNELIGCSLSELIPERRHHEFQLYLKRIKANGTDSGMLLLTARDGGSRVWQYHNVLDHDLDEPYVLGHAQDISEQQRVERKLRELAERDSLTGCFNRRFLAELAKASAADARWGCIAFDLDRFKQVNDTYGHQRGDEVLVAMARFLREQLRAEDIVVRLGGDEFLIFLPNTDPHMTEDLARRIDAHRRSAPIAFTMGWAIRQPGQTLEAVLAEADRRLYQRRALRQEQVHPTT
jgi:diguanylate cyclase (GGDEF)-like protein/PAS domain S-box-containing protein